MAVANFSLGFSRLERLYGNMFSGINSCKWLHLEGNRINQIAPGSFDGLDNLERLDLNENHLTSLRTDMFRELFNCKKNRVG